MRTPFDTKYLNPMMNNLWVYQSSVGNREEGIDIDRGVGKLKIFQTTFGIP
jgi:hypothetical protein